MAVKDLFVPYEALLIQVCATEIEPMRSICRQFFMCLGDERHPSGFRMKEMYYLPYPFQMSFAAHCMDYTTTQEAVEAKHFGWMRLHQTPPTPELETWKDFSKFIAKRGSLQLPSFMGSGYNFDNMREGRLDALLTNCITPDEYHRYANSVVVIDQERTNFILDTSDIHDRPGAKSIHIELRTHVEERFVDLLFDGIEEARGAETEAMRKEAGIAKPSTHGNITLGGTVGKIMVTTFGKPRFGKLSRQYLMMIHADQIEELKQDGLDESRVVDGDKLAMVDFGDYPVDATDRGHFMRQVQPVEFMPGYMSGEVLHDNTTMYSTLWHEY